MSTWRSRLLYWFAPAMLALVSCSDAYLYGVSNEDPSPDRLGVTGRVCTDDAREAGFPVKVLFIVDTAQGPLYSDYDLELLRIQALRDTLGLHEGNSDFSFGIIGMAGSVQKLAPSDSTYFTQNPGDLDAGTGALTVAGGCIAGTCRDYDGAFDLAQSMIEGDLASMNAGERSRTQYVIIGMMAGPPDPLECWESCCDDDDTHCDDDVCTPDWDCTLSTYRSRVSQLRESVTDAGGLALSFHAMNLYATDPVDDTYNANLQYQEELMQQLAFAGGGTYERFNNADAITLERIGLLKISELLEAKTLMVTNRSVVPSPEGPKADSDGDGMSDEYEDEIGTNKQAEDSDGDGLGDSVEMLISFNPLVADDKPNECNDEEGPPYGDLDLDSMNNCEELLLGTDISLPDSDGDGIVDWFEAAYGTDYLRDDALDDADSDGSTNGDELLNHTDPRSSDANSHLSEAYRYEVTDEGFVTEPTVYNPNDVTGVSILEAGVDTVGGLGTLRYIPGDPNRLSWQDAADDSPGPVQDITGAGEYMLPSSSVSNQGYERWLQVQVDPGLFPPVETTERILVDQAERHCIEFTVRNIKLMETTDESGPGGMNDVYLYFAEAPEGRLESPGLFRAVHIPVEYHKATGRKPSEPLVEVKDGEFTAIGY